MKISNITCQLKKSLLFSTIWIIGLTSCNQNHLKDYTQARSKLDTLTIDSLSIDLLTITAKSLYERDNYESALKYYNKIIKIDSLKGEFFFKRGICKHAVKDFLGAITDFTKSIELNYRKSSSYFNIGNIYMDLNDESTAINYHTKALELEPENKKYQEIMDYHKTYKK